MTPEQLAEQIVPEPLWADEYAPPEQANADRAAEVARVTELVRQYEKARNASLAAEYEAKAGELQTKIDARDYICDELLQDTAEQSCYREFARRLREG